MPKDVEVRPPTDLCVVCEHERQYHQHGICAECLGDDAKHVFEFDYAGHKAANANADADANIEPGRDGRDGETSEPNRRSE